VELYDNHSHNGVSLPHVVAHISGVATNTRSRIVLLLPVAQDELTTIYESSHAHDV
jgi:hypothetical protein